MDVTSQAIQRDADPVARALWVGEQAGQDRVQFVKS